MVEPVSEPEALIEVLLRLGRRRRDAVAPVAESLQQGHFSCGMPRRVAVGAMILVLTGPRTILTRRCPCGDDRRGQDVN